MRYGDTVDIVVRGGKASHEGVVTCGSVWSCPMCSSAICARRADELTGALAVARSLGWYAYLVTLTVPHTVRDELRPLFELVAKSWQRMLAGKAWGDAGRAIGFEGYVRGLESTTGRHGFHPHAHAIILTRYELPERLTDHELAALPAEVLARVKSLRSEEDDGRLQDWRRPADEISEGPALEGSRDDADLTVLAARYRVPPQSVEGLRLWLWRRWARTAKRLGLAGLPSLSNGVRVDASNNAARYLAKMGLAREITVPAAKVGRVRNITHWQLLHRCNDRGGGSAYDRARWQEWVEGTKRRKQLTWAKGLRDKLGLGEEESDDAIAAQAAELERRLAIDGKTFDARLRWQPHKLRDLEHAVAAGDTQTIAETLGSPIGWSYTEPENVLVRGEQETPVETSNPCASDRLDHDHDPITGEVYDGSAARRSEQRRRRVWSRSRVDKRHEDELRHSAEALASVRTTARRDRVEHESSTRTPTHR